MSRYVKISALATPIRLEQAGTGQEAVDRMQEFWKERLEQVLPEKPDLILLPELCDAWPCHDHEERREYYRVRGQQMFDFFAETASQHRCNIAFGTHRHSEQPGKFCNSLIIVDRTGQIAGIYDKRFPTTHDMEFGSVPGGEPRLIQCDFGTVAGALCFDLNFEELRREIKSLKPDLILFASYFHGGLIRNFWAFDCRCHLVSAIAGDDSGIVNPVGEALCGTTITADFVTASINLDCKVVPTGEIHPKLHAIAAKYGDKVRIHDPDHVGVVLVSSESEAFGIDAVLREFEVRDYDTCMDGMRAVYEGGDPSPKR